MKKILMVSGSMPPLKCGIGYYTDRLLDHADFAFDLLTTTGLNDHKQAGKTHYIPNWKLTSLPALFQTCRQYRVVHVQYPAVGYHRNLGINFLPYLLRWFSSAKIIVTLHEYHGSGILGRTRNFITALASHQVIVSNQYDATKLPWILRRKARVIPIGSNIARVPRDKAYYASTLKQAGFSGSDKVGVFFGFAFPSKGLETAILAAAQAKLQLLLLTELNEDNSYHQTLLTLITQANKDGAKIHVAGYESEQSVSKILQEADYFVLPQQIPLTGKSGTAIAAATHGLTVISTAADDPDLNLPYIHGFNAVLVHPTNTETLASAIANLNQSDINEGALAELGDYFAWDKIVKSHKLLYKEIVS